ncbi:hypothetical protein K491DRAFT_692131 [Lophiostoma macrostomum CBS 122681]|uniref:Uncharacterized protein n=1 Tax=Lophiostoma macrostomum CBS 122681 TaxID=1314788 RepID=A0A6A6TAL1_9PLEO|nr:hypothetical protein K491DRAFT_692131 [Lophiostoma macrostomum CBS 122681]
MPGLQDQNGREMLKKRKVPSRGCTRRIGTSHSLLLALWSFHTERRTSYTREERKNRSAPTDAGSDAAEDKAPPMGGKEKQRQKSNRSDYHRSESSRPGYSRPEGSRPEHPRRENHRAGREYTRSDYTRPEYTRPDSSRQKSTQQDKPRQEPPPRTSPRESSSRQGSPPQENPRRDASDTSSASPKESQRAPRSRSPRQDTTPTPRDRYRMWKDQVDSCLIHKNISGFSYPEVVDLCPYEDASCVSLKTNGIMCVHELQTFLKGADEYSVRWLKKERVKWHPDVFAKICSEGFRDEGRRLGEEMFKLFGLVIDLEERKG